MVVPIHSGESISRGLLAQFRDVSGLARCAIRLLRDKELSSLLGSSARDFAAQYFNDKTIRDIEFSVFDRFFQQADLR